MNSAKQNKLVNLVLRKCQRDSGDHHKTLCKYICQLESQQQSRQMNSAKQNKLVNLFLRKCQRDSGDHHKTLCKYICQLESQQQSRQMNSAKHNKLVNLVGRKCIVTCSINGIPTDALLDTGAQITYISSDWKEQNLPKLELQPIERLLGISDLELQAVNRTTVPYVACVETSFAFGEESSVKKLSVPVLAVNQKVERPVIGYNVIEQLIQKNDDENCFPDTNLIDTLKYSF